MNLSNGSSSGRPATAVNMETTGDLIVVDYHYCKKMGMPPRRTG